jgi:hypothetical protein
MLFLLISMLLPGRPVLAKAAIPITLSFPLKYCPVSDCEFFRMLEKVP